MAQETFLRLTVWVRRHPEAEPTLAWLFTVAHNVAVDLWRRHRATPVAAPEVGADSPDLVQRLAVRAVMERLRARDRLCLWLFYYGDWSVAEIARAQGVPEATVKTRLHRARKRFAAVWSQEMAVTPDAGGAGRG